MSKLIKELNGSDQQKSIYEKYADYASTYQSTYGQRTVVLLMVGSFYEIYCEKDKAADGWFTEVVRLCELNVSEKKKVVPPTFMAGFPEYTLDKYVQILVDTGFTVVVINQDEENSVTGDKKKHMVHSIYSPGTYIAAAQQPQDTAGRTNNLMSLWAQGFGRGKIVFGIAILNLITGQSFLTERTLPFEDSATTFDELERVASVYNPCELIVLHKDLPCSVEKALSYSGLNAVACIHVHDVKTNQKAANCENPPHMALILDGVFGLDARQSCEEFHIMQAATRAFCFALDFAKEHNPALLRSICSPQFTNAGASVVLANHTLKQLNMIDDATTDSVRSGKYSSVLTLLNKACTAMGRRRIRHMITNPVFDETWLNAQYDRIETLLSTDFVQIVRQNFQGIQDLERMCRQIVVGRFPAQSLSGLVASIEAAAKAMRELGDADCPLNEATQVLSAIHNAINIGAEDPNNLFKTGYDKELDKMLEEYSKIKTSLKTYQNFFNMVMQDGECDNTEFVKIHETVKSGSTFILTKSRAKTLKTLLDKGNWKHMPWAKNVSIDLTDVKIKAAASGANDEVVSPIINNLFNKEFTLGLTLSKLVNTLYAKFVENVLEKQCLSYITAVSKYVEETDALQTRVYVAKTYNYCKPVIEQSDCESSFVSAFGLRHALIEHLQTNEIYVPNDVVLRSGGILLYGTNAVGKTSLIRAIGIATLLAQAGFYVPCTAFIYKPYCAFYTRILGADNLYRGLSTFGVEMSELRVILKNADARSMVLGDELCSGTETQSALSIFVAGLMRLHEARSSFIFATHFHEIVDYDEIKALDRLQLKHMSVVYDRTLDALVYDRLLKDGAGDSMYGLEVCKSLHLPADFLEQAFQLRTKYFPASAGGLSAKKSRYNAQKLRGICEQCGEAVSTEVHHLVMQSDTAFAYTNHVANLMALCERCHQDMHSVSSLTSEDTVVNYKETKKIVKKKKISA